MYLRYSSGRALQLRGAAAVAGLLWLAWVALLVAPPQPVAYPYASWVGPVHHAPTLPLPWPHSVTDNARTLKRDRFRVGTTLAGELERAGVSSRTAARVVAAAGSAFDVRRIRAGHEYTLYFADGGELLALRYHVNRQNSYVVALEDAGWRAVKVAVPVSTESAFVSATIIGSLESSLADHVRSRRSANELALKVADLYGWDVDFGHDLQLGDRIDLVVEERFIEGEFIGYGGVLAAEFRVMGRTLPAVRFVDASGASSYFTPNGDSLRRTFLRSPVKYSRISSRFTYRRVHPITGVARAHRGVDYVAAPGSPVQATADGVIETAGYGREQGRYVKIRHGGSYSSYYLHLSRIESGMRRGVNVRQGDVIGYVGKTGLAAGYHLHYGLKQNGRYVDPLQIQFPAAEPVPANSRQAFVEQRDRSMGALRAGQTRRVTVQVAGGALP